MDCRYCQKLDAHPICEKCKREFGYHRDAQDSAISSREQRRYEDTGRI